MQPWFQIKERQDALWLESKKWEGTPFFANAASCGHGVGCVNLIHELWVAVQAIPRMALPAYTLDHAKHSTKSQLLKFLMDAPELEGRLVFVPPTGKLLPGDLLAVQSGRIDHHLACVVPWGKAVHAVQDAGVVFTQLSDERLCSRVLYVLRLMDLSQ